MRRLLYATFALPAGTLTFLVVDVPPTLRFCLAALGLLPLAWLIGEATDHAGRRVGSLVGGLLNASFGNAVELFVSYFALSEGAFDVVRGSLTGSVLSNLLLVLGLALVIGPPSPLNRRSLLTSIGQIALGLLLFLVPAVPFWMGVHRPSQTDASSVFPVCAVLLVAYGVSTAWLLRREQRPRDAATDDQAWSLRRSLVLLLVGVAAAGFVSEIMTTGIGGFARELGVSQFFVAAVLVAIAGNAAEHGSAILVAARGNVALAAEVALKSASQVAAMLLPLVAMLSWLVRPLPLAFRALEFALLGGAVSLAAALLGGGRGSRWRGGVLAVAYGGAVAALLLGATPNV